MTAVYRWYCRQYIPAPQPTPAPPPRHRCILLHKRLVLETSFLHPCDFLTLWMALSTCKEFPADVVCRKKRKINTAVARMPSATSYSAAGPRYSLSPMSSNIELWTLTSNPANQILPCPCERGLSSHHSPPQHRSTVISKSSPAPTAIA